MKVSQGDLAIAAAMKRLENKPQVNEYGKNRQTDGSLWENQWDPDWCEWNDLPPPGGD